MPARRALACLTLGVLGLGSGLVAAVPPTAAGTRALALVAGLCAGGAGLLGRSTGAAAPAPAAARDRDRDRDRKADLRVRLAAAEQALSELTGDVVGSSRPPREGEVLIDPVTGLSSEGYLLVALEARMAAARRRLRPISVVMFEVVVGVRADEPTPADPQLVAAAVRSTLRAADTASRTAEGRYVLVLEDTGEDGAIWSVERLRSRLVTEYPDHTLWAGVACYPAHAFNLDEILHQAGTALEAAKEWRQDRIEVATAD